MQTVLTHHAHARPAQRHARTLKNVSGHEKACSLLGSISCGWCVVRGSSLPHSAYRMTLQNSTSRRVYAFASQCVCALSFMHLFCVRRVALGCCFMLFIIMIMMADAGYHALAITILPNLLSPASISDPRARENCIADIYDLRYRSRLCFPATTLVRSLSATWLEQKMPLDAYPYSLPSR